MKKLIASLLSFCMVVELGALPVMATYENKTDDDSEVLLEEVPILPESLDLPTTFSTGTSMDVDWAEGGSIKFDYSTGYITSADSTVTSLNIPSSINGTPVVGIDNSAFRYCSNLTTVTIPDSVTSIGSFAFNSLSGLTSMTIPDSVTNIGGYAFQNCTNLKSINIPSSVINIPICTFEGCTSLEIVDISNGLTEIGFSAFRNCISLATITLPNSLISLENNVFQGCTSLISIKIPDSVTSIDSNMFLGCNNLTSVSLSTSLTTIPTYAFYYLDNLTSIVIPDSVTKISLQAFWECDNLKNIYYSGTSEDWTNIDIAALNQVLSNPTIHFNSSGPEDVVGNVYEYEVISDNEVKLTKYNGAESSLAIPTELDGYTVAEIGDFAFDNCTTLQSIHISSTIRGIGSRAFIGCTNLTAITVEGGHPYFASHEGVLYSLATQTSAGSLVAYPSAKPEDSYDSSVITGISKIGDYAFFGCQYLKTIQLSSTITSIGVAAFADCSRLTSIAVEETSTNYASLDGVLYSRTNASLVAYPAGKTELSYNTSSVAGVTKIEDFAFYGCSNITVVQISSEVTDIGAGIFIGCDSLIAITVMEGNVSYASSEGVLYCLRTGSLVAYPARNPAESYDISSVTGVRNIEDYAFYGSRFLTEVTISNTITSIGKLAFYGCTMLEQVNYIGTEENWSQVFVGAGNDDLNRVTIICTDTDLFINLSGFVIEEDAFSFINSGKYTFGVDSGTVNESGTTIYYHYLTDEMEEALRNTYKDLFLLRSFSGFYREIFGNEGIFETKFKDHEFNGVCRGMTQLTQLLQQQFYSPQMFDSSSTIAYNLQLPSLEYEKNVYSELKIAIYYYQLLQYLDQFCEDDATKSKEENLEQIVSLLQSSTEPIAIAFGIDYKDSDGVSGNYDGIRDGGHLVLAYGIDIISDPDYYILQICDPNKSSVSQEVKISRDFAEMDASKLSTANWKVLHVDPPVSTSLVENALYNIQVNGRAMGISTSTASTHDYNSFTTYSDCNFIVESNELSATILNGTKIAGDLEIEGPYYYSDSSLVSYRFPLSEEITITYINEDLSELITTEELYSSILFGGVSESLAMISSTTSSIYVENNGIVVLENGDENSEIRVSFSSLSETVPWVETYFTGISGDISIESSRDCIIISSTQELTDVTVICSDNVDHKTKMYATIGANSFSIEATDQVVATIVTTDGTVLDSMNTSADSQEHIIVFDTQGGTLNDTSSKTDSITGKLTSLLTPTKELFEFIGWFDSEVGGIKITTETVFTKSTTIYAQWIATSSDSEDEDTEPEEESTTYTITFNAQSGSSVSSQTTSTDGTLSSVPTTTRTGYTFDGWYTASSGGTKITTSTVFSENTTVYAQWTANTSSDSDDSSFDSTESTTYTITFDANGGSVSTTSKTTNSSGKITSLPTPTREGYTFDGWFTTKTGSTKVSTSYVFSKASTVYAQWTEIVDEDSDQVMSYTISFDATGGTSVASRVVDANGQLSSLPTSTRTGYTFHGWYTQFAMGELITSSTTFTGHTTLFAQWIPIAVPEVAPEEIKFSDVSLDSWYYDAVKFVSDKGLMGSTGSGKFSPNEDTTRGMMVTILHSLAGYPTSSNQNPFVDVISTDWYGKAILWALENDIATGKGEGVFDPKGVMTREQLVVMLYGYEKTFGSGEYTGTTSLPFTDADTISWWAKDAMTWCVSSDIVGGRPDGSFDPQATANRAEVAIILKNFVELRS